MTASVSKLNLGGIGSRWNMDIQFSSSKRVSFCRTAICTRESRLLIAVDDEDVVDVRCSRQCWLVARGRCVHHAPVPNFPDPHPVTIPNIVSRASSIQDLYWLCSRSSNSNFTLITIESLYRFQVFVQISIIYSYVKYVYKALR